jgi:hypothetical protein
MSSSTVRRLNDRAFAVACPRCDYELIEPSAQAVEAALQLHLDECSDDTGAWKSYDFDEEAAKRAAASRPTYTPKRAYVKRKQ